MVVIDHEIEELSKSADRIILMNEGRILLDLPPNEFVEYADTIEAVGETIPAISKLFYQMKKSGRWHSKIPITVEEAITLINDDLKKEFAARICRNEKIYGYGEKLGEEIISVKNLTHVYPDGTVAISDVNLNVRRGEFLAIIGSNGSGKTTLAKHLNGLLKPTKGTLKVCGIDIPGPRVGELSKHVGYVFQNPDHQLFCNTVMDELMFSPLKMGIPREAAEKEASKVMNWLGLTPWRDEQPFFLGKGQRRCLAVGAVLTVKPEVLVVDEPTTGQDWRGSVEMMNLLTQLNKELGITVLIITHNMRLVAEYCERVIAMSAGKIIYDGLVKDFFLNDEILRQTAIKPPQLITFFKHLFKNHDVPIRFKEIENFQPISKL
jgi:energy-coupling factor transport system ATP-binding protein